jgi:hypothetical protein
MSLVDLTTNCTKQGSPYNNIVFGTVNEPT